MAVTGTTNPTSATPAGARRTWAPGGHRRTPPDAVAVLSQLNTRDRHLLQLVAEHQVLTTEQITALLFPNHDRAQRRLLTLFRAHVLDRFRRPGLDGSMTSWRYALGPVGAAVLAAMRGTDAPRPAVVRKRLLRLAAHPHLDHLLGVNGFFAALAHHARTNHGPQLQTWWSERRATDACGGLARPDGLGIWRHTHRHVTFCLEYDTGTENLTQVTTKLDGYTDLSLTGGPRLNPADHSDHDPAMPGEPAGWWVLFHLHSTQRETHLRRLLDSRATTPHAPGAAPLGIATTSAEHTRHHNPAEQIWLPLGTTTRKPLAALTHARTTAPHGGGYRHEPRLGFAPPEHDDSY